MIKNTFAENMDFEKTETTLEYETENECPRCKTGLIPNEVKAAVYTCNKKHYATVMNFCPKCKRCFLTTYKAILRNQHKSRDKLYIEFSTIVGEKFSEPESFKGKVFSPYIVNLSKNFIETYNQSEYAEASELTQIAGMGYRKALEFLVKDYAIHKNPDKINEIEPDFLSHCIKEYIDNPNIQTLAEKSAWLGNDETHYKKERTDRGVSDMKIFINACVGFIEGELAVEDANSIQKV